MKGQHLAGLQDSLNLQGVLGKGVARCARDPTLVAAVRAGSIVASRGCVWGDGAACRVVGLAAAWVGWWTWWAVSLFAAVSGGRGRAD